MTLTEYGRKEWLTATVLAAVLLVCCAVLAVLIDHLAGISLGLLVAVVWLAFVAFFRDPVRHIPEEEDVLVSPADGVVRDCELIPNGNNCGYPELSELFEGRDMFRIGIFLSVLDVHVNRAPCRMTVRFCRHKDGQFHDARDQRAGTENESQLIGGIGEICGREFPVAVKQISGAIARRIVCPVEPGAVFEKGYRYGMIKFGSRTELYLPVKSGFEPAVSVGDRVFGGVTVIARCRKNEEDGQKAGGAA
ncbi:MAG: phosphatidylserine decarboxylase family protein [Lentisphaeria bacterium]|nr:phosphatidylserine decarboxylase family protein [Lentisphaeria bacterium]